MLETIYKIQTWMPWVLGGSTLALLALVVFAFVGGGPILKIVQTIVDALSPLLRGACEGIVWAVKKLGASIAFCATNPPTYAAILAALLLGGYFLTDINPKTINAKAQVSTLQKENAELKKAKAKPAAKNIKPKSAEVDNWSLSRWLR